MVTIVGNFLLILKVYTNFDMFHGCKAQESIAGSRNTSKIQFAIIVLKNCIPSLHSLISDEQKNHSTVSTKCSLYTAKT